MLQHESIVELDIEDFHQKFADTQKLLTILSEKTSLFQSQINAYTKNSEDYPSQSLTEQINSIFSIFIENGNYLNSEKIFKEDLIEIYRKLIIILDIYSSSLSKVHPDYKNALVSKLTKDVYNFQRSLSIFISNITDITSDISKITKSTELNHERELEILYLRLGLECCLFKISVYVAKKEEFPFFKSNFLRVYHYYNEINNITDKVSLIDSYCGTGKTTCIPLILFCKNLKEGNKSPFILIVMKDPYHVKSLMNMLEKSKYSISKYVSITNDIEKLEEIYKNFKANQKVQNLTFGVLTTYNFLPLMHKLADNEYFIPHTRFIIDQINQKTCHISVIISRILELNNKQPFKLPLNFSLLSSKFPIEVINFFGDSAKVTKLAEKSLYEIKKEVVEFCETDNKNQSNKNKKLNILKQSDKRIKRAIKRNLYRMAESRNEDDKNNQVEEGNVLVFLPDTEQCRQLHNQIIKANFNDKNNTKRKIFIVNITLKTNESYDSFLKRLKEKIDENEKKKKNGMQFLYFVPFYVSGVTDERINKIFNSEFPPCLNNVKKLIFSTSFYETLNINDLSVVIDRGLVKEERFNPSTRLSTYIEKLASKESRKLRKGRLGRSMNGLYISFTQKNVEIDKSETPSIQIHDLTKNYLMMKQVNIDLAKMKLIYEPNKKNLETAIKILMDIDAIDKNTLEITDFGNELLKFDFIPIQYATAVVKYSKSFNDMNEKKCSYFISAYISLIIANAKLLIRDEKPDKLLKFFDDDSDIVTLFNALNSLLKEYKSFNNRQKSNIKHNKDQTNTQNSDNDDKNKATSQSNNNDNDISQNNNNSDNKNQNHFKNQNFIKTAEKYGFHPFKIVKFIKHLHIISDYLFAGENSIEIINKLSSFIKKHDIYSIIDDFIQNMDNEWKEIHYFNFKIARLSKTVKNPELVFLGSKKLIFDGNKGQTHGKVFLTKRPGWKGIVIPSHCYIFDININTELQPYQKYVGHLIHRAKPSQKAFDAIELEDRYIFNPWFNVLLESYFSKDIEKNRNTSDVISFYPSRICNKIILSFVNNDKMKEQIKDAVDVCVKLLPFTPRSVLIYKNTTESITEIKSIGSFDYNSMDSTFCRGAILDKNLILHCIEKLNEISRVDAKIRICSLFINDTCDPSEYDTKNLYLIDTSNENIPGIGNIQDFVKETYLKMKDKIKKKNEIHSSKNPVKYGNFQFSPRLVNPTLFLYEKSRENIMEWFHKTFPSVYVKEIRNHNLKMKISDIHLVQDYIDKNLIKIEAEMKLDYVAISFPLEIKKIITDEHEDWYVYIDEKHNTMIVPKEKLDEIRTFIIEKRNQSKNKKAASYFAKINKLPSYCYNACADPENNKLTDSPITYYFESGETYTSKLCQSCIYSSLCYATQRFYTNEKTNSDYLGQMKKRPSYILRIPSEFNEDGTKCWPQVPFGQLISVLFDNDDAKLTSIVSAYLRSINDYTMRFKMQKWLTFCPQHFDKFYKIDGNEFKCLVPGCQNFYCNICKRMHINIDHEELICNKCNRCKWPYIKEEGCDIIECPSCGYYFCYLCGIGFESNCEANLHLLHAHPKNKYNFEYEKDNYY